MLILIADADPTQQLAARAAIERFGYRCQEAASGRAAWDAICTGQPEIVLASVDLPEIDGLDLAARLRALQRTPACYFVAVTPAADPRAAQIAMASGADGTLARPFDEEHLTVPHAGNPPSQVVTVSVGVAAVPPGPAEATYDALLGWAERALVRAKGSGGNRVALNDGTGR